MNCIENKSYAEKAPFELTQIAKWVSIASSDLSQALIRILQKQNSELEEDNKLLNLVSKLFSSEDIDSFLKLLFSDFSDFLWIKDLTIYISFNSIPKEDSTLFLITEVLVKYREKTWEKRISVEPSNVDGEEIVWKINFNEKEALVWSIAFTWKQVDNNKSVLLFSKIKKHLEVKLKQIAENKRLKKEAYIDYTTQIWNRRYIEERITDVLISNPKWVYIMYIYIDNFEQVNNLYWSITWDRVLKLIALVLHATVDKISSCYIWRNSWWQFLCVLEKWNNFEELEKVLNKLFTQIQNTTISDKEWDINPTISIWVVDSSNFPDRNKTKLICAANTMASRAQHNWWNRYIK